VEKDMVTRKHFVFTVVLLLLVALAISVTAQEGLEDRSPAWGDADVADYLWAIDHYQYEMLGQWELAGPPQDTPSVPYAADVADYLWAIDHYQWEMLNQWELPPRLEIILAP
jgi:hypothetical protein